MDNFEKAYGQLNEEQKQAVDQIDGPLMVVAGPGTGKTQLLAVRTANILKKTQIDPSNILCLTFTESGASSMKKRLLQIIGSESYYINVCTFHSFCNEIISKYSEKFQQIRASSPLSEVESIDIFRNIIDGLKLKKCINLFDRYYYLSSFREKIKQLKREGVKPNNYEEIILKEKNYFNSIPDEEKFNKKTGKIKGKYVNELNKIEKNEDLNKVYQKYSEILEERGNFDFEDMIILITDALENDESLRMDLQERYQYILVDEFQDTNGAQSQILNLLTKDVENPNIMVVGDDDQAIFRFQGASLENIIQFGEKYKNNYSTIIMRDNYRSSQLILDAAKSLIDKNVNRLTKKMNLDKNLRAASTKKEKQIRIIEAEMGETEVRFIVNEIKKLNLDGIPYEEIAIIFRDNFDSQLIEEELIRSSIPYQISKKQSVLDDILIKQLILILELVDDINHSDFEENFFQLLSASFLEIDPLEIFSITKGAYKNKSGILEYILANKLKVSEKTLNICDKIIEWHKEKANHTTTQLIEKIIKEAGILNFTLSKKENWEQFLKLKKFYKYVKENEKGKDNFCLNELLRYLKIQKDHGLDLEINISQPQKKAVSLLTAHKSKGMEFNTVFIMSCYDKKWGNKRNIDKITLIDNLLTSSALAKADKNEDERRLFYVALTRAKENLYISYANKYYSSSSEKNVVPSQFINEIDSNFTEKEIYQENEKDYEIAALNYFNDNRENIDFDENIKLFLQKQVENLKISPTSVNKFLLCPRKFMYDNIIRVPKSKTLTLAVGTAVHSSLEKLMKQLKLEKLLTLNELLSSYKKFLQKENLSTKDFELGLKKGGEMLSNYYQNNKYSFVPAMETEFDFSKRKVMYEGVPITGKIDKIELIDEENKQIRIIDYKTGSYKSLNQIMGKTKEENKDLMRQGYFYVLLAKCDRLFKYKNIEIVFDFIKDNKRVSVPLIEDEYEEFKWQLKDSYEKIKNCSFEKVDQNSVACNGSISSKKKCEYFDICWGCKKRA